MGELGKQIVIEVWMLGPKTLSETIEMAQMMEQHLSRQTGSPLCAISSMKLTFTPPISHETTTSIGKKILWNEMQWANTFVVAALHS